MTEAELILSLSMLFAGSIGSLALMYLRRISTTLESQIKIVTDIDKRVVAVETKITGTGKGWQI